MPERYEYPPTEFDPKPRRASAARVSGSTSLFCSGSLPSSPSLTTSAKIHQPSSPCGPFPHRHPGHSEHHPRPSTRAQAFSFLADSASPDMVLRGLILFSVAAVIIVGIMLIRFLPMPQPYLHRARSHPRRSRRQSLRSCRLPLRHRLHRLPHRPLSLARLQLCRLRHRHRSCLLMIEIIRPQPENTAS